MPESSSCWLGCSRVGETTARCSRATDQGNAINLIRLLRGELRGLDLSHLLIWQAYLQDVDAQDASLVGAQIAESVLGSAFDALNCVAVSSDATIVAAGTLAGDGATVGRADWPWTGQP